MHTATTLPVFRCVFIDSTNAPELRNNAWLGKLFPGRIGDDTQRPGDHRCSHEEAAD
jgi:hypothetical protein